MAEIKTIVRCGNPRCGNTPQRGQRMADVSFFIGVVRCPRCHADNEIEIWDGQVVTQETKLRGKRLYYYARDQK